MAQETRQISSGTVDSTTNRRHSDRSTEVGAILRTMELEVENLRLQQLVAELLLKNQQLRRRLEA